MEESGEGQGPSAKVQHGRSLLYCEGLDASDMEVFVRAMTRRQFSRACRGNENNQNTNSTCHSRILVGLGGSASDPALKLESVEMV